jgi:chromosome segregation protein
MEMKGFKSFADKTTVDFKSGISCIIGPNGSGKSNITDALRWVLGEQKVSLLRGSSMRDVIFKGTDHRKPLGRAEISLFFDNTENFFDLEYDEVKITRRLYMSGESEYLINNTKTRLMDIRELIMDTGIGSDGYSIVSQGKINSMITANKDEIRSIFEEAAGITMFKKRKKDSTRKLENTTMNLERIEDIVYELEKQVGPLKKESEKAREYKKYYDELKSLELAIYSSKLKNSDFRNKYFNKKISDLYLRKEHNDNYYSSLKRQFNQLKNEINLVGNKIEEKEKEFYQMNDEISSKNNELNLSNERLMNTEKNIESIKQDLGNLEKSLSNEKSDFLELVKENNDLEIRINEKEKILDSKKEDLETSTHSVEKIIESNRKINQEVLELERKANQNTALIGSKKESISQLNMMVQDIDDELLALSLNNEENVDLRDQVKESYTKISDEILNKTKERSNLKEEINNLGKEKSAEVEKYNHLDQQLSKTKAEYKLLKSYEENYKGYYHSVKKLMTSILGTHLEENVHGVVGSLMTIDKKYEVAIEITLGSSMQNVVCNNVDSAKDLINHLKSNNFGRVSFLPLSNLYKRYDQEKVLEQVKRIDGYIGKANEIINCDPQYDHLFNHLLGNVLVVNDYDTAKKMLKINDIRYKLVTLEGETFSPGGRITGGSFKSKAKGLLGRKRKIKTLKEKIIKLHKNKESFVGKIGRINESLEAKSKELELIDDKISELKDDGFELKSKLNYLNDKLKDYDQTSQKKVENKKRNTNKIEGIIESIQNLEEENKMYRKKIASLKNELKEDSFLEDFQNNLKSINNEVTQLKIQIASLKEKKDHIDFSKKSAEEDLESLKVKINSKKTLLVKSKENLKHQEKKIETYVIEVKALENKKTDLKSKIDQLKKNLKTTEALMYQKESIMERVNEKLAKINNKLSDNRIEKAKNQMSIKNIKEDLWQKYEMSYLEALNYEFNPKLLVGGEQKRKALRLEIKKIGNVNLSAIEKYEEVSERYEHLSEQEKDLRSAKKSLEKIIRDLDKRMEKQFIKELDNIREYFKEVFRALFNGGEADIKVEDMNEILECEIKIMAQPPGKKLQTLDLLSGGEKALTAISLLFAILKNKPTPFCVLDEIEAALDDVNVDRFAAYLKEIVNDSQFILITHRKGTMEIADCLYGVTMEEKGVSKIVSLKLEDIEQEIV